MDRGKAGAAEADEDKTQMEDNAEAKRALMGMKLDQKALAHHRVSGRENMEDPEV